MSFDEYLEHADPYETGEWQETWEESTAILPGSLDDWLKQSTPIIQ